MTFWVSPHLDEWHVQREDNGVYEGSFDARDDAVAWACRVAQRRAPCLVRVQDGEGNITAQYAFDVPERAVGV